MGKHMDKQRDLPGLGPSQQRGQVTVLLATVMALAVVALIAIAMVGEAVVHRARARNAADAVALAGASDPGAADELARWYEDRGASIMRDGAHVVATSGPSSAAAWASGVGGEVQRSPVLVAVLARIEQLSAVEVDPVRWDVFAVALDAGDAAVVRAFSVEFGLCEWPSDDISDSGHLFGVCGSGP